MGQEQQPRRRSLLTLSVRGTSPGQRFRIQTWGPHLASGGIDVVEHPFADADLERVLDAPGKPAHKVWGTARSLASYPARIPCVGRFDGILIFRDAVPVGPPLVERLVGRRANRPVIFDIDDPIFLHPPGSGRVSRAVRGGDRWRVITEAADVTICINEEIAAVVRPHARRVEVIGNAIDLARYPIRSEEPPPTPRPVVGFSGSASTTSLLLAIEQPLRTVAQHVPFDLHVIGGTAPFSADAPSIVEQRWSAADELRLLHQLHVGLAPAPDDEWNRHKFFVKVLLYMAAGLPVIASAVGSPARIIEDGVNGFLARDEQEWTDKLNALLTDGDLRRRLGRAARVTVERDHALDKLLPRVYRVFDEVLGPT